VVAAVIITVIADALYNSGQVKTQSNIRAYHIRTGREHSSCNVSQFLVFELVLFLVL
jgi:hypothetical protein